MLTRIGSAEHPMLVWPRVHQRRLWFSDTVELAEPGKHVLDKGRSSYERPPAIRLEALL